MKATFFITYIMVDGWSSVAAEILRVKPLIVYHLKNTFLVKTERDREQAMNPGSLEFATSEPRIQLYFLLGLVYSVVTPILLPFILMFFGLSYLVFRHQVCSLCNSLYTSLKPCRTFINSVYIYIYILCLYIHTFNLWQLNVCQCLFMTYLSPTL